MPRQQPLAIPDTTVQVEQAKAREIARVAEYLAAENEIAEVIRAEFPELAGKMTIRTAVLDWRSRQLETLV